MELSIDHMQQTSVNNITTQMMTDEHVQPHTFTPHLHTLLDDVRKSVNQLLETFKSQFVQEFKSQFVQDETSVDTIHLTKM